MFNGSTILSFSVNTAGAASAALKAPADNSTRAVRVDGTQAVKSASHAAAQSSPAPAFKIAGEREGEHLVRPFNATTHTDTSKAAQR